MKKRGQQTSSFCYYYHIANAIMYYNSKEVNIQTKTFRKSIYVEDRMEYYRTYES